jgi:hypothetical protein
MRPSWRQPQARRAPRKSHKYAFRAAPTGSPRTRRHSAAYPGTHAKIEAKTSPEQAKRRWRRLSAVQVTGGQGQGRTADLPLFRGPITPGSGHSQSRESAQVTRISADHLAYKPILAVVPPCAAECRLVRVTGVLIFANARTCVAFVLLAAAPISHRASVRTSPGGPSGGRQTPARTRRPGRLPLLWP